MAKVVFCNIAWMKFYSGITDNDQPKNGGAFVKENNDACESFNFYPYNHYCLGYVRAPGERLNLARVEDVPDDVDKIESHHDFTRSPSNRIIDINVIKTP